METYGEVWKPFHAYNSYMTSNTTEADRLWNSFNDEKGWISLSHTWAEKIGLSRGLSLPEDPDMGLFILDGYHQMHCLVSAMQSFIHSFLIYSEHCPNGIVRDVARNRDS